MLVLIVAAVIPASSIDFAIAGTFCLLLAQAIDRRKGGRR